MDFDEYELALYGRYMDEYVWHEVRKRLPEDVARMLSTGRYEIEMGHVTKDVLTKSARHRKWLFHWEVVSKVDDTRYMTGVTSVGAFPKWMDEVVRAERRNSIIDELLGDGAGE